ncbi:cation:proton antiporter [Sanguibacter sp. Leaf3]|uniref:cation:proton antiporter n=1 Tax=Sanguibacter sp. Leaf3 TaxID=1736209 RepID=UPI000B19E380|nr:monovalent cation/H(+) antiporter subunit G [Sanguibacter sp. Leaf3]
MNGLDVAGQVLVVLGALVFVTAALGVVRFPDAYTRISAVGTAGGAGIVLVVVGALLLQPGVSATIKVAVIVTLQLATSSIGTMAVARSAYLAGTPLRQTRYDDLDTEGAPR